MLAAVLAPRGPLVAWDGEVARRLIGYGIRGHLGSVSPIDTFRLDQVVVALFLPVAVLGLYVTAMTFVTLNRMIGVSLGMVAFPVAARTSPERARRPLLQLSAAALVLGGIAALLEIAFGRTLLELLFGPEFRAAYNVLAILAVASIAMNVRGVLADWLRGAGWPGLAALGESASLLVLLPAFALLWNGRITGVAAAVLLASAVGLAVTLWLRTHTAKSLFATH